MTDPRTARRERGAPLAPLRALFRDAPVGLGVWDRELRYVWLNPALAAMNGLPLEDHLGRRVGELLPGLDAAVHAALRRAADEGEVVTGVEVSGETPAAPGRRRRWRVAFFPVEDDEGAVAGVVEEVTGDRMLLEEVVMRSPAAIALLEGREHRYRLVNEAYRRLLPAGREARVGNRFGEESPEAAAVIPLLDAATASGRRVVREEFAVPFGGPEAFEGNRYYRFAIDPLAAPVGGASGLLVTALEVTDLVRGRAAVHEELAREREIATALQEALLPQALPAIPGAALATRYRPAGAGHAVGGDFYDAFENADGSWTVLVGDVGGKGAQAAAVTAMARYTMRAAAAIDPAPGAVLAALNAELLRHPPGGEDVLIVCSAVAARIAAGPEGLEIELAAGGHPPPVLVPAAGPPRPLDVSGPLIGHTPAVAFPQERARLEPGGALVLYSDGLLDAFAPRTQREPEDLAAALAGVARDPESLAAAALTLAAGEAAPRDDIALLVLGATGG